MKSKKEIQIYEIILLPLYDKIYRHIRFSVSDEETAEDLTQEVYRKAWEKIHQLKVPEYAQAWLSAIASNEVRSWYRRKKRTPHLLSLEELWEGESYHQLRQDLSGILRRKEAREALEEAIWSLDKKYREVLSMNLLLGIPETQIAEDLGVNYNTVRSWKHRGMKQLKSILEKKAGGENDGR